MLGTVYAAGTLAGPTIRHSGRPVGPRVLAVRADDVQVRVQRSSPSLEQHCADGEPPSQVRPSLQ